MGADPGYPAFAREARFSTALGGGAVASTLGESDFRCQNALEEDSVTNATEEAVSEGVEVIVVGKLEAARRQLETAVRLYFAREDAVSLHTLTMAPYEILRDITRARPEAKEATPWDHSQLMVSDVFGMLRRFGIGNDDAPKIIRERLRAPQNFFKHAKNDGLDAEVELRPATTEMLLWDACRVYQQLTGENVPVLIAYQLWWSAHHPEMMSKEHPKGPEVAEFFVSGYADIRKLAREDFYRIAVSVPKT